MVAEESNDSPYEKVVEKNKHLYYRPSIKYLAISKALEVISNGDR